MTKRKAIQAAMERWVEARRHRVAVDIEDVIAGSCVEKAYELGRIAGLREAARDMERGYDDPEADKTALAVNEALDELALQLRSRANRLAKNVRTK